MVFDKTVKIKLNDWEQIRAALVIYAGTHFQDSAHQRRIERILEETR